MSNFGQTDLSNNSNDELVGCSTVSLLWDGVERTFTAQDCPAFLYCGTAGNVVSTDWAGNVTTMPVLAGQILHHRPRILDATTSAQIFLRY
jgi:hypothetical protein